MKTQIKLEALIRIITILLFFVMLIARAKAENYEATKSYMQFKTEVVNYKPLTNSYQLKTSFMYQNDPVHKAAVNGMIFTTASIILMEIIAKKAPEYYWAGVSQFGATASGFAINYLIKHKKYKRLKN